MIQTATVFKTPDGRTFDNKVDAENHVKFSTRVKQLEQALVDKKIEIDNFLETDDRGSDVLDPAHLPTLIAANAEAISEALSVKGIAGRKPGSKNKVKNQTAAAAT